MLPKKGRKLPMWEGALAGRQAYAEIIAELLRKEHGDSHRAVKQLMRQTDASERTVKHWLAAQHGPDTVFFLRLIATSPVIRAYVLGVIEGSQSDQLGNGIAPMAGPRNATINAVRQRERHIWLENDRINDPKPDPINDPITDALNERQRWFLDRVGSGLRCRADELAAYWEVSLKTARRDIAGLCVAGHLQFVGARRNGQYRVAVRSD
jgi:hypothetical protein